MEPADALIDGVSQLHVESVTSSSQSQSQSQKSTSALPPLLRVPAEIRRLIYKELHQDGREFNGHEHCDPSFQGYALTQTCRLLRSETRAFIATALHWICISYQVCYQGRLESRAMPATIGARVPLYRFPRAALDLERANGIHLVLAEGDACDKDLIARTVCIYERFTFETLVAQLGLLIKNPITQICVLPLANTDIGDYTSKFLKPLSRLRGYPKVTISHERIAPQPISEIARYNATRSWVVENYKDQIQTVAELMQHPIDTIYLARIYLKQIKEEANDRFRAGRYVDALSLYAVASNSVVWIENSLKRANVDKENPYGYELRDLITDIAINHCICFNKITAALPRTVKERIGGPCSISRFEEMKTSVDYHFGWGGMSDHQRLRIHYHRGRLLELYSDCVRAEYEKNVRDLKRLKKAGGISCREETARTTNLMWSRNVAKDLDQDAAKDYYVAARLDGGKEPVITASLKRVETRLSMAVTADWAGWLSIKGPTGIIAWEGDSRQVAAFGGLHFVYSLAMLRVRPVRAPESDGEENAAKNDND